MTVDERIMVKMEERAAAMSKVENGSSYSRIARPLPPLHFYILMPSQGGSSLATRE